MPRSQALSAWATARQKVSRSDAELSTTSETPWVNPAEGARSAAARTASSASSRHRPSFLVRADHAAPAQYVREVHRYQLPPKAASALSLSAWQTRSSPIPRVAARKRAVCGIR